MKLLRLTPLIFATLIFCLQARAASVRGRITRNIAGRTIPAGGLSVTVQNSRGVRSFAVTTDGNGMYFLPNIAAGSYTLQVWPKPGSSSLNLPITVREPGLDVNPLNIP